MMFAGFLERMVPHLTVTVEFNRVRVRWPSEQKSGAAEAPFSCSHLLIADQDCFEHAASRAIKEVVSQRGWTFPRIVVNTGGRTVHTSEKRAIREGLLNAGASTVLFLEAVSSCTENELARDDYIRRWTKNR